jgi:hypothetical protein
VTWLFAARKRFCPQTDPEGWRGYLEFSGFRHIEELVSADSILCGDVITELVDEDWAHNFLSDNCITRFRDSKYLLQRPGIDLAVHNVLAIIERPSQSCEPVPANFETCGFDILDTYDSVSVLTNCGQHPGIVDPNEVNQFGLIPSLERANEIAENLRKAFPKDAHCRDCRVWLIARCIIVR